MKATGGAISKYNGKIIHAFTSSGVFQVTSGSPISNCEVIVVGGGGGGGINSPGDGGCGGGGAGGVLYHSGKTFGASTTYPVSIGGGGAGGQGQFDSANNGTPTVFTDPSAPGTLTATGGGRGRGQDGSGGGDGGSGGGGSGGGSPPGGPEEMATKHQWVVLQDMVIMVVLVSLDLITEVAAEAALDRQVVLDQTNLKMDLVDMDGKCQ